MKFAISLMLLLNSFMAMAAEMTIQEALDNRKCQFEVVKEVVVEYSKQWATAGNTSLTMHKVDRANNRRLKVGRVLNIIGTDESQIMLKDDHVQAVCILTKGYCDELSRVTVKDFNQSQDNKLKLVCNTKPTIDI